MLCTEYCGTELYNHTELCNDTKYCAIKLYYDTKYCGIEYCDTELNCDTEVYYNAGC